MTCHRCGHEDARHASRLDCKAMCDECHAEEGRRYDAHQADPAINPCPTPLPRSGFLWWTYPGPILFRYIDTGELDLP